MKTFNIIAFAVLISLFSTAQQFTNCGTVELGGQIAYSSQSTGGTNSESQKLFVFSPYFGFMLAKGFELGVAPQIASSDNHELINIFLAPGYSFDTKSNVYPYIEFIGGYGILTNGGTEQKGFGLGGGAGLKINIGTNGLIVTGIQFTKQDYSEQSSPSYSSSVTSLSTMLFQFGYTVFLSRSEKEKNPGSK